MPPRPPPTHFLCIPLSGAQLTRSLASFKADVTSGAGSTVLPEQAVRPPGTLHLTLGVMTLRDDAAVARAVSVLGSLRLGGILEQARAASSSPPRSLALTIQGLGAMRKASATTVLYAPPTDPAGVLRRFCENLRRVFLEAGLMADEGRPLLLHATVVNTIYVRGRGRRAGRLEIDARDLISRYRDYVWAVDLPLRNLAICRMGAKPVDGSDGDQAYEVEAQVGFEA